MILMNYMVLVNKEHVLKKDLDLDLINVGKNSDNEDVYLERKAGKALLRMLDDVNGIYGKNHVVVSSGYRSFKVQQDVLDYYINIEGEKAYSRVAFPGESEHHTGLGIDVGVFKDNVYEDDPTGDEPELKWMFDNAYKYGFILRYPKGKEKITGYRYEPWHFRYVGSAEKALLIKQSGLTLDEYVFQFELANVKN